MRHMGRIRRRAVLALYFIDTVTQDMVSGSALRIEIRQPSPVIRKEEGCVVIMEQPGVDSLDIVVSGGGFSPVGLHAALVREAPVQIRYLYLLPSPDYPFTQQMAVIRGTCTMRCLYAVRAADSARYKLMDNLGAGERVVKLWGIERFLRGQQLLLDNGEQYALVTLLEPDDETEHGYRIMEESGMDFLKGRTKVYSVIRIFPDESGRFCVAYDRVHKDGETIRLWGDPVCPREGNAGIDAAIGIQIQEGQEIEILVRNDRLTSLTEDRS